MSLSFFVKEINTSPQIIFSNGRAPALHAGSTGIDKRILQNQDFCDSGNNFLVFSFFFVLLFCSFICTQVVACQDLFHRITALNLLYILLPLPQKVLVVHSLSPTAEEGEDHDFGVSDDSGVVIESKGTFTFSSP